MRKFVLGATLLTASLLPLARAQAGATINCPSRDHLNPAANETCGQARYPSKAARDRCAYQDRLAQMTKQEREYCEMKARVEAAEGAHKPGEPAAKAAEALTQDTQE